MANFFNKIAGLAGRKITYEEADDDIEFGVEEEVIEEDTTDYDEGYEETTEEDSHEEEHEEAEGETEAEELPPAGKEPKKKHEAEEDSWFGDDYAEGQLSIDVYQTPDTIVVKSTIAGVKPEDIDISINNDLLTIRGKRHQEDDIPLENYLFKECYWGSFSRSVILPVEVEADKIEAFLENGVLTVSLPKAKSAKQISIRVKER